MVLLPKTKIIGRTLALLAALSLLAAGVSAQGIPIGDPELDNIGLGVANNNNSNNNDDEIVRLLFKYKNQNGKSDAAALAVGGGNGGGNGNGGLNIDIPRLNLASVTTTRRNLRSLQANPNIESVDIDQDVRALGTLDQTFLRAGSQQRQLIENTPYGITMVQADDPGIPEIPLWSEYPKIKVCIVDTGYDLGHVDLPSNNVNGYSPYFLQYWDNDGNGHGTHVAGTIGAIGGNGQGVDSILRDSAKFDFFIGKGLQDNGSGSFAGVFAAIDACVANGAKVVNLSLGGGGYSQTDNNTFRDFVNQGVLFVAAAGNEGDSSFGYPASYPHLISVASVNSNEGLSSFSQYNNQVELAAPGGSVLSTVPRDGYAYYSGTSMATPHVAGVAALIWSHFPQCSNIQIRNVLFRTAKDKGAVGCDIYYGAGIVQAKAAYDLLSAEGCEAGGITPATPSDASIGGCGQYTGSTSTFAPSESSAPSSEPSSAPTFAPSLSTSPSSAPVACTLASVGGSCSVGTDCCSGICSGGKPTSRVCLSSDGGGGGENPPPPSTCSDIGEACSNAVCCAGLSCSSGKKNDRFCFDPNARAL